MAQAITVRFVIDPTDADVGKIVVDVDTDLDPASIHYLEIIDPAAATVTALADDTQTGTDVQFKHSIPLDSDGAYLEGAYSFQLQIDDAGDTTIDYDETHSYTFTLPNQNQGTLDIDILSDCYSKTLIVTDNTSYPTGETVSRTVTIVSPTITGEDPVADSVQTTSPATLTLVRSSGVAYWNVTYSISVHVALVISDTTIDAEWDFGITYAYADLNTSELVNCDSDPCGIIDCVHESISSLISQACSGGGIAALGKATQDKYFLLNSYLSMYVHYIACKDSEKVHYYYDLLKALIGECDCLDVVGAQVISDSTIVYLNGKSAYQLWLDAGNVGTLDDFFNTLYPVGSWQTIGASVFNGSYETGTEALKYRILKTHIEFLGDYTAKIGAPGAISPVEIIQSTFDPGVVLNQIGSADVSNTDGEKVGEFYYDGTSYKVRFGSGYNDSAAADNQRIKGLVPIVNLATTDVVAGFSEWTTFPTAEYQGGFVEKVGQELEWRTDGRFLYIRGEFDGVAFLSSGSELFNVSYFTAQGLTLSEGSSVPLYETDPTAVQAQSIGYAKVNADGDLWVYFSTAATPDGVIFTGIFVLEA